MSDSQFKTHETLSFQKIRGKMKMTEPGKWKLEMKNFLQQAKHSKVFSDPLQVTAYQTTNT